MFLIYINLSRLLGEFTGLLFCFRVRVPAHSPQYFVYSFSSFEDEIEAIGRCLGQSATILQPQSRSFRLIPPNSHLFNLCLNCFDHIAIVMQIELEQYPTGPHIASRFLFTVIHIYIWHLVDVFFICRWLKLVIVCWFGVFG